MNPRARLHVNGDVIVTGDIALPAADVAEEFAVTEAVEPGSVMVLGDDGALTPSAAAYDRKVAGVVSGAGGYRPGIVLDRGEETAERVTIAIRGRARAGRPVLPGRRGRPGAAVQHRLLEGEH